MKRVMNHVIIFVLILSLFFVGCTVKQPPSPILEEIEPETTKTTPAEEQITPYPSSVPEQVTEKVEPETTQAVPLKERKRSSPLPGEFVAFSLSVAQQMITELEMGQDYRAVYPDMFQLGGINWIHGLAYDHKEGDIILVGKHDPERQPLTLDDFVVALRSRFIYDEWPLVSIDPTPKTEETEIQIVRFEGGIKDTQFGQDLFDADYRLKRIGIGLLASGIPELKTYRDVRIEEVKKQPSVGNQSIGSRFWFYPVLPSVSVREDVVAIKGLKVGVFTEVLSAEIDGKKIKDLSSFHHTAGEIFAKSVSENFERLARVHPSFARLQGLDELVALVKAVEEMEDSPNLTWWLKKYRVKEVKTPREIEVLKKKEEYEVSVAGEMYQERYWLSGGVRLMAIALRLKAGDVTALREAVFTTRPTPESLIWSFVIGEWVIPTSPGMLQLEDIASLFAQALFLQEKEYYDDAITLYGKVIELQPDWDWPYNNRGNAYAEKGLYDQAIADHTRALEINPDLAGTYTNRGLAYAHKGLYDQAIADHTRALEINPEYAEAYNHRGLVYAHKGRYGQAIADHTRALEINPDLAEAYTNRGNAYAHKGRYDQAIADHTRALEINPEYVGAYTNRGNAYARKGLYDQAIADHTRALEINPEFAAAYSNRGLAYADKGLYDQAIADHTRALEIDPEFAAAYSNRGLAYADKGLYDQAIADYTQALEINPEYAEAYTTRGNTYADKGIYDQAIADYTQALVINPDLAEAFYNRGIAYAHKGRYGQAIADHTRALEIDPKLIENKGKYEELSSFRTDYKNIGVEWTLETPITVIKDNNGEVIEAFWDTIKITERKFVSVPVSGIFWAKMNDTHYSSKFSPTNSEEYMTIWFDKDSGKLNYSINLKTNSLKKPIVWHWKPYTDTALNPSTVTEAFTPPEGALGAEANIFEASMVSALSDEYFMIRPINGTLVLNFTRAGLTARVNDIIGWGYEAGQKINLIPGRAYKFYRMNSNSAYIKLRESISPGQSLFFEPHNIKIEK